MQTVWFILALVTGLLGCGYLSVSMPRNWRIVSSHGAPHKMLRYVGWLLIVMSFAFCLRRYGASFGVLLWPLVVMISGFSIAFLLAYKPSFLSPLAIQEKEMNT